MSQVDEILARVSVNLPRWGLKQVIRPYGNYLGKCKFTPLGFETQKNIIFRWVQRSVNLPRWGLKPPALNVSFSSDICVNLPRWGLKLFRDGFYKLLLECKFTPLGFETRA